MSQLRFIFVLYTYIYIYIYIYSSYDEGIQRKQSAQYRERRAMTVKVTLTSDDDLQTGLSEYHPCTPSTY